MTLHIRVCTTIDATPARVWDVVERVDHHVDWMRDARAITFRGSQRHGVGTEFECLTQVGPLRTNDVMRVTEWRPREAMGIEHAGVVRGVGRFTLRGRSRGRTRFCWDERLRFPWWMGGVVGEQLARPVLRSVWKHNLAALKADVESRSG